MTYENDTFGPWTPPGGSGRPPGDGAGTDTIADGEPTTPAVVDAAPFWLSSTGGILDLGTRNDWERCQLGPFHLPGLARVVITKPAERKIDVKSPDGKSKAKLTVKGWEPAEVEIQLLLWTPAHWAEWRKIRPQLRDPADRKESDPFEIVHPVTYDAGIGAVLVKNIGGLEDGSIRGTKTVKIPTIEWVAEAKTTGTGTPKGAKTSGSSNSANRKSVEEEWLAMVAAGSPVSWEELARANGIDPPGPPPPVPPESDYNNPNYWDE